MSYKTDDYEEFEEEYQEITLEHEYNICDGPNCKKVMNIGDTCLLIMASEINSMKIPHFPTIFDVDIIENPSYDDPDSLKGTRYPFRKFCSDQCLIRYILQDFL